MSQDKLREAAEAVENKTREPPRPVGRRLSNPTCTTCGVSGPRMKEIKGHWKCPDHQPDNKQEVEDVPD